MMWSGYCCDGSGRSLPDIITCEYPCAGTCIAVHPFVLPNAKILYMSGPHDVSEQFSKAVNYVGGQTRQASIVLKSSILQPSCVGDFCS